MPTVSDVVRHPARLEALRRSGMADSAPGPAFARLARLTAAALRAPAALVSFVGEERLYVRGSTGLESPLATGDEPPLTACFCVQLLASPEAYAIADARNCERTGASSIVRDMGMVALAGVPIHSSDGHAIGGLCVMDREPREWSAHDLQLLRDLAESIVSELELRHENAERQRAAAFAAAQRRVLEHIAGGLPVDDVLSEIARLVESAIPGAHCTVMLAHERGLSLVAAPSLPATFLGPGDVIPIGPAAGTCGTAAFLREPVITREIAADPRWAGLHELAARHGLRSCWSTPILRTDGEAVGTFALYHDEPWEPAPEHARLVLEATHLARIAIQRERSERALRESEERYALAARLTSNAIWDWNRATGTLGWTGGLTTVFGHPIDERACRGDFWQEHLHPEDAGRMLAMMEVVLDPANGLNEWHDDYRFRRGDGSWARVVDRGYVVRDASGTAVRMVGAMEDVTERHELEERLRQAQKMEAVGQLAGGVAHDFNNLLTVITGNLEFVRKDLPRDLPDEHPVRDDLREISEAAERARNLVQQLLTFSRKQAVRPRRVRVDELVIGAERLLRRLIGEEIMLEVSAGREAVVLADPGQLEQVLMNLALNARDAMLTPRHGHPGRGGTLMLAVDRVVLSAEDARDWDALAPGAWVRLRVRDTGHGMDAETRSHIFEPFFTTKDVGAGTGLGLATVFGIVRQAGGAIRVDSAPGRGTTFTILLPAHDGAEEPASPRRDGLPPRASRISILLVEDEPPVRHTVRRALERMGYHVLEAANGEAALAVWRAHRATIGAVVTDVRMPELGGPELAARLRAEEPSLAVVFMTGYADGGVTIPRGPADGFVAKPFTAEDLAAELVRVLAGAGLPSRAPADAR